VTSAVSLVDAMVPESRHPNAIRVDRGWSLNTASE